MAGTGGGTRAAGSAPAPQQLQREPSRREDGQPPELPGRPEPVGGAPVAVVAKRPEDWELGGSLGPAGRGWARWPWVLPGVGVSPCVLWGAPLASLFSAIFGGCERERDGTHVPLCSCAEPPPRCHLGPDSRSVPPARGHGAPPDRKCRPERGLPEGLWPGWEMHVPFPGLRLRPWPLVRGLWGFRAWPGCRCASHRPGPAPARLPTCRWGAAHVSQEAPTPLS